MSSLSNISYIGYVSTSPTAKLYQFHFYSAAVCSIGDSRKSSHKKFTVITPDINLNRNYFATISQTSRSDHFFIYYGNKLASVATHSR